MITCVDGHLGAKEFQMLITSMAVGPGKKIMVAM